jgi:hypothetical protein
MAWLSNRIPMKHFVPVTMIEIVRMNGLAGKKENTISQIKVHDETPFI